MKLDKMIVCNGSGQTETYHLSEDGSIITTFLEGEVITVAGDPFAFYVVRSIERGDVVVTGQVNGAATNVTKNNGQKVQGNNDVMEVQIVMPLGGKESGLFRQPRVGEKVLIGTEETDSANYLMGYIPSLDEENSYFSPSMADKKAEVFRFNNNGANFSDTAYSEIGFYHNPEESFQDVTVPMDSLRINSTGNINALAANRFSLSADDISIRAGGAAKDRASISVDAAGNVTISAKGSISLKTGRTSLSLSESGFNVKSKIGDTAITNTWDAGISLSPLRGFSATGLECKLNAVRKSVMSEKMGGMVTVNMGLGTMKGREIGMNIYNASEFKYLNFVSDLEFIQNIAAFGTAEDIRGQTMELEGGEDLLKTQDEAAVATEQADLDLQKAWEAYYLWNSAAEPDRASRRDEAQRAFDTAEASEKVRKEKTAAYYEKIHEIRRGLVSAQNRYDRTQIAFIWINYLNKHLKALYDIYREWKDLAETKKELSAAYAAAAREKALAAVGITAKTPEEIAEAAKEKYEAGNAGKKWDDLDKKTKDTLVGEEKAAIQEKEDKDYLDKKKEEYKTSDQRTADKLKAEEQAYLSAISMYARTELKIWTYDELSPGLIASIKAVVDNNPVWKKQKEDMQKQFENSYEEDYPEREQEKHYSDTTGFDFHTTGGVEELPPAPTPALPPAPTPTPPPTPAPAPAPTPAPAPAPTPAPGGTPPKSGSGTSASGSGTGASGSGTSASGTGAGSSGGTPPKTPPGGKGGGGTSGSGGTPPKSSGGTSGSGTGAGSGGTGASGSGGTPPKTPPGGTGAGSSGGTPPKTPPGGTGSGGTGGSGTGASGSGGTPPKTPPGGKGGGGTSGSGGTPPKTKP
jgi:hypothetical protein